MSIGSNLVGNAWAQATAVDGFVPISLDGWNTNSPFVFPYKARITNGMIDFQVRTLDASVKSITLEVDVLYVRSRL